LPSGAGNCVSGFSIADESDSSEECDELVATSCIVFGGHCVGCILALPPVTGLSGIFFAFRFSLPPPAGCSSVFFAFCCSSWPVRDFLLWPSAGSSVADSLLPQAVGFSEDEAISRQGARGGMVLAPDT